MPALGGIYSAYSLLRIIPWTVIVFTAVSGAADNKNFPIKGESEALRGPKLSATSSAWLIQEYLPNGRADN